MFNFLKTLVEVIQRLNSYYYYSNGIKGTVLPVNAANYVKREVDVQVYEFIKNYEQKFPVCYVFGTPQSGKSSLRLRTAKKLEEEGYISISLSAQTLSSPVTEDLFYSHLVQEISYRFKQFGAEVVLELQSFWQTLKEQSYEIKFPEFIRQTIRFSKNKTLVIFLDDSQNLAEWEGLRTFLENLCIPNFVLVLFGNVHPSKVLPLKNFGQNPITVFEISPLEGECPPLQARLRVLSRNPKALFQDILTWTGGQPFLTQFLCSLAVKWLKIENHNATELLRTLVQEKIVQKWTSQPVLVSHFQAIEDYYIQGDPRVAEIQFLALEIYKQVLQHPKSTQFSEQSLAQRELLVSGLVTKCGEFLDVANPIYGKVFDLNWIEDIQKKIIPTRCFMTSSQSIYNRDVYFLIDASGSMTLVDAEETAGERRYDYLKEIVAGHVDEIIRPEPDGQKISDSVGFCFFNLNMEPEIIEYVSNNQLDSLFIEHTPTGKTFIVPTFDFVVQDWKKKQDASDLTRTAFFVIYVDGRLTDEAKLFNTSIKKLCSELSNQNQVKVLILGVGREILSEDIIEAYLRQDLNANGNSSKNHNPCNIVVFDLLDEMRGGLKASLIRELNDNPLKGIPTWLSNKFPRVYDQLKKDFPI
jgi:hypothetical protein